MTTNTIAFQTATPLQFHHRITTKSTTPRRPRSSASLSRDTKHDQSSPQPSQYVSSDNNSSMPLSNKSSSKSLSRRIFLAAAAAAVVTTVVPNTIHPSKADATGLAPTPINPYARRRREKVYKEFAQEIEQRMESVAVADFKKVVQAGGGGFGVSYRIAGFAAFVASAISTAIVHPIDSIKTRLQARSANIIIPETDDNPQPKLFQDLYKGIGSNILKEAPNSAIYLGVYEIIKSFLMNLSVTTVFHDLPLFTFLVAGALGDAIGSIVRVPAEIVNKRLQLGVNSDWKDASKEAFLTKSGRESSFVAWTAVLLRDVPYGGLQIMMYEFGRMVIASNGGPLSHLGVLSDVLMGAIAGALAAMVTTPADVLVTRLSVQHPQSYLETRKYMDVPGTARRILDEEGIGGFFSGTVQRGAYYAPLIGLFFALYEGARGFLVHPEVLAAKATAVEHALLTDWNQLPHQIEHMYQQALPAITGLSVIASEQLPWVLSFITLGRQF